MVPLHHLSTPPLSDAISDESFLELLHAAPIPADRWLENSLSWLRSSLAELSHAAVLTAATRRFMAALARQCTVAAPGSSAMSLELSSSAPSGLYHLDGSEILGVVSG